MGGVEAVDGVGLLAAAVSLSDTRKMAWVDGLLGQSPALRFSSPPAVIPPMAGARCVPELVEDRPSAAVMRSSDLVGRGPPINLPTPPLGTTADSPSLAAAPTIPLSLAPMASAPMGASRGFSRVVEEWKSYGFDRRRVNGAGGGSGVGVVGGRKWLISDGMGFGSIVKWWGDCGKR